VNYHPSRRQVRKLALATLILVGPLLGCLRASQGTRSAPPMAQRSVVEQLSELLGPQNVQVSSASIASSESAGTRELRVKWVTSTAASTSQQPKAGPPPVGLYSIAAQQRYTEPPPRQRSLEIASGRLLIAAVDRTSRLKSWMVIADPRIVRAEGPGPDGILTGQILHMEQAEFFLSIPDEPDIVELRMFEPQLVGAEYRLTPVGSVSLSR
jgi:hypothetical protein